MRAANIFEPPGDAYVEAEACTSGQLCAWARRVSWRRVRKCEFVWKVLGVGGRVPAVPRDRRRFGGAVGRRVRMCVPGGPGKTYYLC